MGIRWELGGNDVGVGVRCSVCTCIIILIGHGKIRTNGEMFRTVLGLFF